MCPFSCLLHVLSSVFVHDFQPHCLPLASFRSAITHSLTKLIQFLSHQYLFSPLPFYHHGVISRKEPQTSPGTAHRGKCEHSTGKKEVGAGGGGRPPGLGAPYFFQPLRSFQNTWHPWTCSPFMLDSLPVLVPSCSLSHIFLPTETLSS